MVDLGWSFTPRDSALQTGQGWGYQAVFGNRLAVPNGTMANVWSGAAATRPLPLAAVGMSVVSSSANDTLATALGARLVVVTFIDSLGDWRTSDLLALNGTTPVPITHKPGERLVTQGARPSLPDGTSVAASIFRVQDVSVVSTAGATEAAPRVYNQGAISVVKTTDNAVVYDHAPAGVSRGQSACFHCPRGYVGRLTRVIAGIAKGQGVLSLSVNFGADTAYQRLVLASVNDASVTFDNDAACTPLLPGSSLQASVQAGSNNIDINCVLEIRLEPSV